MINNYWVNNNNNSDLISLNHHHRISFNKRLIEANMSKYPADMMEFTTSHTEQCSTYN